MRIIETVAATIRLRDTAVQWLKYSQFLPMSIIKSGSYGGFVNRKILTFNDTLRRGDLLIVG